MIAPITSPTSPFVALAASLVLGLRHAADPDHLTAVSTLVLGDHVRGARRAGRLGLAWGLGHASTLVVLGLPIVLTGFQLPPRLAQAADFAIGLVILALALRLLWHWRRSTLHAHQHRHDGATHLHLHAHTPDHAIAGERDHHHQHATALGRTPLAAYVVGLVHGVGGSAVVGLLLVSSVGNPARAVLALLLFAGGTAVSMAAVSAIFGHALARGPVLRQARRVVPVFGLISFAFGLWYALAAVRAFLAS